MGTRVASNSAINTMGAFESQFVYTYSKQPLVYLQYIDDIFIIWQHGMESLLLFIDHLNNCSDNRKFTHEVSKEKVNFLDALVKLEGNWLITDLFSKPIDSHTYLVYNSSHSQRCKDTQHTLQSSFGSGGFAVKFWILIRML